MSSRRSYDRHDHHDRHDSYDRSSSRKRPREDERTEALPDIDSVFRGEVVSIQAYGAFIKIPGHRKNGLVHKSQISTTRVEEVSDVLSVGDQVFCQVISLGDDGNNKISLSMKDVNQSNGKQWDRENLNDINERDDREDVGIRRKPSSRNDDEPMPELYSIFKGEVMSIQDYGAFVKIPGYRKNGLVHKSQLCSTRVEEVSDVVSVGDRVFCKVISLGEDGSSKISLSMKVVSQGDGKDQDPNQVITNQEEMKRNKGGGYTQKSIELGAVFNTVCRTCGVKGHLSQNCFSAQGGKSYELLPELDLPAPTQAEQSIQKTEGGHAKKKKKKKEKKKHKKSSKKKHKHKSASSESDSSSSDSDSDSDSHRKHHQKKHRDRKKASKRKHKHKSSSSDSDSSSSDSGSDSHHRHHQSVKHRDQKGHKRKHRDSSSDGERGHKLHRDSDRERRQRHTQKTRHRDR